MKKTSHSLYGRIVVLALTLFFGLSLHAEPARDELVHAFRLMKMANGNYGGHRNNAMHAVEAAGKELNIPLGEDLQGHERQWKSDAQMNEARHLLVDVRAKLEWRGHESAAAHVDQAIKEINLALEYR